jgi:outer membrane protein assembly factor BamC
LTTRGRHLFYLGLPLATYFRLTRPLALTIALATVLASGCAVIQSDKIDYKSAGTGPSLEVPPDLSALSRDTRYVVPGGPVTANSYTAGQQSNAPGTPVAASSLGDVRIERSGNQRWLVVGRSADTLWNPLREFWQENGFLLTIDQQNLGILETDWAENRAKIPQDFIRNTLGKVFDSLYSTGERDKFRTRIERTSADAATEIYISHRGMVEKLTGDKTTGQSTIWEPRTPDPELETEFLRRLMVKLGVPQEQSKAILAAAQPKQTSRIATVGGSPVLQIDEGFDTAWRRVGLALDRTGFTVEDRDRAQGIYFVRYVEPTDKKDAGFFSKLFSSKVDESPQKFRITVKGEGQTSTVAVLNGAGVADASDNAKRIIKVIADDLK